MRSVLFGLLAASLALACDDGDGGDGAGGAGGGGATDLGVIESPLETFTFTELQLREPMRVGALLTNLLNSNLNAGAIIVLVQIEGWGTGGDIILRGGAGQQTAGIDTAQDFSDDSFTWLNEGECADADGNLAPCSVDINERAGTQTGDEFEMTGGEIEIYSEDLNLIIPIKALSLTGSRDGAVLDATLSGVITQADAAETRFRLTPEADLQTLEGLLEGVGVMPDTELDGAAAYTFAGTFNAELITFEAPASSK